jgi:transposase
LVKSQDQQKISQLETHIRRLEEERLQLENDLRLKNEELRNNYNDEEQIHIETMAAPVES